MNLTVAAWWSREIIKYTIALVVFLLVGRVLWGVGFGIYRHFVPQPPAKPTVQFGKLPSLSFPTKINPPAGQTLSFSLELPEGDLPKTAQVVPVYVVQARRPFFGALDQTRQVAEKLDFTKGGEALSTSVYRFTKPDSEDMTLDINTVTGVFAISSNLSQNPELLSLHPPGAEIAASTVRSYLSSADLLPEDLSAGTTNAEFLAVGSDGLKTVSSVSEAQLVRIDLFRQSYSDIPIVTPTPGRGNVWFMVSGEDDERQIVAGEYHYFGVNKNSFATYPLKTAAQAFEELKNNQGAYITLPPDPNIVIRRVYLAYFDNREFQDFFQPVFVFEGDNGFVGYVPAVTTDYYGR